MEMSDYWWWQGHRYKNGRPDVQDESSADQWRKLAEYAESKLEEAYKVGYYACDNETRYRR